MGCLAPPTFWPVLLCDWWMRSHSPTLLAIAPGTLGAPVLGWVLSHYLSNISWGLVVTGYIRNTMLIYSLFLKQQSSFHIYDSNSWAQLSVNAELSVVEGTSDKIILKTDQHTLSQEGLTGPSRHPKFCPTLLLNYIHCLFQSELCKTKTQQEKLFVSVFCRKQILFIFQINNSTTV